MPKLGTRLKRYVSSIRNSGLTIYDSIEIGDPDLWIPAQDLEALLNESLRELSLAGLPIKTRSKFVKQHVCIALGYPAPPAFTRTKPRFPGQCFDTYVQKSNNLQVWNEELASTRRYVIIRVSKEDVITGVKVVSGDTLARLDTTGTLTQKYQALLVLGDSPTELVADQDTDNLSPLVGDSACLTPRSSPTDYPALGNLLPVDEIFTRLRSLLGMVFADPGHDQERNRGAELHRLVCRHLGYANYQDDGRFPDVRHQLVEVKLQTSPTIDLGLICPDSTDPLDLPLIAGRQVRHCDVRYALFYARTDGHQVTLTHLFVTTGEQFRNRFSLFGGKGVNKKLQVRLPLDFFAD